MLRTFRKNQRPAAIFLVLTFLVTSVNPAMALSSGPSQPEHASFAPAGLDNMVDPFTGDFSYNIPLLDVDGYPVNICYNSGVTQDMEASWVGLGWNLNVGSINRNTRGLPDDFSGDKVSREFYVKPNQTVGVTGTMSSEIYGYELPNSQFNIGFSSNFFYNNYTGFGMSMGVSPSISSSMGTKNSKLASLGLSASLGSESGVELTPSASIQVKESDGNQESSLDASISAAYSTREGLKSLSLSTSFQPDSKSENLVTATGLGSMSAYKGFATPTYSPQLDHDTYNVNASIDVGFAMTDPGTELAGFGFGGYYSGQYVKDHTKSVPAYGFMYSGISDSPKKMMDVNREKEAGFNEFTTNLPVTNFTYDIFNVNGQGISGTYRLNRGDVGAVHDPETTDDSYSPSIGIEIGGGPPPSSKVGVDVAFNYTTGTSGPWPAKSDIKDFKSNDEALNTTGFEPAYFKKIGEMTVESDMNYENNVLFGRKPMTHDLKKTMLTGGELTGDYVLEDKNAEGDVVRTSASIPSNNKRSSREIRKTNLTHLSAGEAVNGAIVPLYNYGYDKFEWNNRSDVHEMAKGYEKALVNRVDEDTRKEHHISEIRVSQDDGSRYVYGVPVYNRSQKEVTFSTDKRPNATSGLITYDDGDNEPGHKNGDDHYFNRISTPPYATSYLLSAILSNDYVDRDEVPGPSDGDLGTYKKFNYTRTTESYRWRTPMSDNVRKASFTEGIIDKEDDDRATYSYGKKEVWYLHSIETKNYVAEFHLRNRKDGLGAQGEDGGISEEVHLKYLEKIVLYAKSDKKDGSAIPIKTVHFSYNYTLCPNTPNSVALAEDNGGISGGKLTLKKIWFTYGNSHKGVLNPYIFSYGDYDYNGTPDVEYNPPYSYKAYDRWGNYKPTNANGMTLEDFPYANQIKSQADKHAAVYAMNYIRTPSGAHIRVFYESDDYGYVQNKPAMRMFNIIGTADVENATTTKNFFYAEDAGSTVGRMYLDVNLDEGFDPVSNVAEEINKEFRRRYLSGVDMMYYKVRLTVVNSIEQEAFVPGYAEVDVDNSIVVGAPVDGKYKTARIKLKTVPTRMGAEFNNANTTHPIVRTGWMYARLNLFRELKGLKEHGDGLRQMLGAMISQYNSVRQLFTGFGDMMRNDNNSRTFDPAQSYVRLNDPDKIKAGGGHRVKAVVMSDSWTDMKSDRETADASIFAKKYACYGQRYDYSMVEAGETISSGVAAYEPIIGGEENPLRQPVFVREKVPLAPDREYFLETPFGESFFPAPVVGYRKVTVTPVKFTTIPDNLAAANAAPDNGTGKVINEFYTAYDFPSITKQTRLESYRHKPNIVFKFMKFNSQDLVTCSQGYYVETNDMHGKPKATRIYPDQDNVLGASQVTPVSEIEYRYKQNDDGTLNSSVTYVKPDLSIERNGPSLGVDIDVVNDERHYESNTVGGGLQFNLKYYLVGVFPVFVPTGYPDFNFERTRFRSVVTTKVVQRNGILESVVSKDGGAVQVTKNLAWDRNTGEVVLTSTKNEFNDLQYSFTFPGYWAYDRMDLASKNEGALFEFNKLNNNTTVKDGDEVLIYSGTSATNVIAGYVCEKNGVKSILNENGDKLTGTGWVRIVRSGHRNMAMIPIGTIVCLDNPVADAESTVVFNRILNASATEYKDDWKRFCNCEEFEEQNENSNLRKNHFITGRKGNMRLYRSWVYRTNRITSERNDQPGIRTGGLFANFVPFWRVLNGKLTAIGSPENSQWQFVSAASKYNPSGFEIESMDPLRRYTMAQFGYGRSLAVGISNNSKYRNSGVDNFEDYDYGDCEDDHLSWREHKDRVVLEESHTGRKSIKVPPRNKLKITKILDETEECPTEDPVPEIL